MRNNILLLMLLVFVHVLFSDTYQRDQATRYAKRYTKLTDTSSNGTAVGDTITWHNINPFICYLEKAHGAPLDLAGYLERKRRK